MVIRIGNSTNPNNIYVGNQSVSRIYQGNTQVWPAATPPSATADINIVRRSVTQVAPEAFVFDITNLTGFTTPAPGGAVYDRQYHELDYYWDFGDSYTFTAPVNLLSEHLDSQYGYGPLTSHTYRAAGTYTVTCTIYEPASDTTAIATTDVTVGNPDTLFSGTNTIFMSPSGDFTDAPAGATQVTASDIATVISSNVLGQEATPTRLMLNRGENYTSSGIGFMGNGTIVPTMHIVASPGGGAKPMVITSGPLGWNDKTTGGDGESKDWVIQNIEFDGGYDSTTTGGSAHLMFATYDNPPNLWLFDGCAVRRSSISIYNTNIDPNIDHRVTVVNDTVIEEWQEYGFLSGDKTADCLVGSALIANTNALADSTTNGGAGYRCGGDDRRTVVQSCDFFTRQGWSGAGTIRAIQAGMRCNTSGYEGSQYNVQASSFESGFDSFTASVEGGLTARAGNYLISKCNFLGSYGTTHLVAVEVPVTISDCNFVVPNVARIAGATGFFSFIALSGPSGSDPTNIASPMRIYNNTFINEQTDGTVTLVENTNFTDVMVENNIEHQPNTPAPVTADAPIEASPSVFTPREIGYIDSGQSFSPSRATPSSYGAERAPGTGSAALDDATTGLISRRDIKGVVRPSPANRGAWE